MVLPVIAFVWYDKGATDDRVWCVKRADGVTVRASEVHFPDGAATAFDPEGFRDLQPSGPRGIIMAETVVLIDEGPL